jgi:hypothetical protein
MKNEESDAQWKNSQRPLSASHSPRPHLYRNTGGARFEDMARRIEGYRDRHMCKSWSMRSERATASSLSLTGHTSCAKSQHYVLRGQAIGFGALVF